MATSLQQPLSSVPKVAIVDRFNCILYKVSQGRALAVAGHPWCLIFASGWLENRSFFMKNIMLGTQYFTGSENKATLNFS